MTTQGAGRTLWVDSGSGLEIVGGAGDFSVEVIPGSPVERIALSLLVYRDVQLDAEWQDDGLLNWETCYVPLLLGRCDLAVHYRRWFFPIVTAKRAQMTKMKQHPCPGDSDLAEVSFLISATAVSLEYSHWLARPIFWLWRQWCRAVRWRRSR